MVPSESKNSRWEIGLVEGDRLETGCWSPGRSWKVEDGMILWVRTARQIVHRITHLLLRKPRLIMTYSMC